MFAFFKASFNHLLDSFPGTATSRLRKLEMWQNRTVYVLFYAKSMRCSIASESFASLFVAVLFTCLFGWATAIMSYSGGGGGGGSLVEKPYYGQTFLDHLG